MVPPHVRIRTHLTPVVKHNVCLSRQVRFANSQFIDSLTETASVVCSISHKEKFCIFVRYRTEGFASRIYVAPGDWNSHSRFQSWLT